MEETGDDELAKAGERLNVRKAGGGMGWRGLEKLQIRRAGEMVYMLTNGTHGAILYKLLASFRNNLTVYYTR